MRALIPTLAAGVRLLVESGDLIEGLITAKLLERARPGPTAGRVEGGEAGTLTLFLVARAFLPGPRGVTHGRRCGDPVPPATARAVGDGPSRSRRGVATAGGLSRAPGAPSPAPEIDGRGCVDVTDRG